MFAARKWIAPVAALALFAGLGHLAHADDAAPAPAGKATVTVTVTDADSKPVEGVKVSLRTPMSRKKAAATATGDTPDPSTDKPKAARGAGAKPVATGTTDKDGKAMLMNVPDGSYQVLANSKGMSGRAKVTVADGKDTEVAVTLKARAPRGDAPATPAAPAAPAAPADPAK